MPLYEYECKSCGRVVEHLRKIAEKDNCPACKECEGETRKITTQMQFKLKGRGWAADGYTGQKDYADLV